MFQIVNLAMFTCKKKFLCVHEKHVKCSLTEPMYVYLRNKETQQILWDTKNMLCYASLWYN